ncbi:MAG: hypothetical protein CME59_09760 [Halioglobus sp.]|nr:hypothetical protein [Halioglobus sp.]|tara:strand:+ start:434 stop:919 length:486 start_codon:yes stop_codon:yes gene_type:complete
MADLHIEDFYRDVAKIFLQLFASFPRRSVLYVEDISGPDEPDEFGLHHPRFQACFGTMLWLAEHGYLGFADTIGQEALDQAVLTRRGFLLLTARSDLELSSPPAEPEPSPSVSEHSRSNVAQLRSALGSASSLQIRECVSYLLAQAPIGEVPAGATPVSTR